MMSEENTNSASDIKLMPIAELLRGSYRFFVPDYQRGYRWTSRQVSDLLEDLLTFAISEQGHKDAYYCLQPVVVRRNGDRWEVIDGQQRLTTIKVLLHWLKQNTLNYEWETLRVSPYPIEYATREKTSDFIDSLCPDESMAQENEPIDFFFIRNAYQTMHNWFWGKGDFATKGAPQLCERLGEPPIRARTLIMDLLTSKPGQNPTVRILWYEADPAENGITLFNRLNTGKLELTDSELVKGLFMLKTTEGDNAENEQFRMALKWERMENALHDDAFWSFLTPRREATSYANRIDLLLELVFRDRLARNISDQCDNAERTKQIDAAIQQKRAVFHHYNERFNVRKEERSSAIEESWKEIEETFLVLEDWFSDPEIYNLVGYLCQTCSATLPELFRDFRNLADNGGTRADFIGGLKKRIRDSLKDISVSHETDENDKKQCRFALAYGDKDVFNLLLLLNIDQLNLRASSSDMKSGERETCKFPFAILADNWDVEHVDSRSANHLEKTEDRQTWIMTSLKDLCGVLPQTESDKMWAYVEQATGFTGKKEGVDMTGEDWNDLENNIQKLIAGNKDTVPRLIRRLQEFAGEQDDDRTSESDDPEKDNISNLVLLDANTNRSYKNALFISKRREIIRRRENGQYVPETTSYVFFKLLEGKATSRWKWTPDDRQCYANYIAERLAEYLPASNDGE